MLRTFDDEDYNYVADWLEGAGLPLEILEKPPAPVPTTGADPEPLTHQAETQNQVGEIPNYWGFERTP